MPITGFLAGKIKRLFAERLPLKLRNQIGRFRRVHANCGTPKRIRFQIVEKKIECQKIVNAERFDPPDLRDQRWSVFIDDTRTDG
jgi:hypothetical protein